VKRAFVTGGITCIPDDSEHALTRALRINRRVVANLYTAPPGHVAANDIIDIPGVDVAPWIPFIVILKISKGSLRNVIAREGIMGALQNCVAVLVNQIADNLPGSAIE
jgi:hypothetical protein